MDNSNIIISVIIVLCIAAGVTAYGISEGDNAVFNDLTGFSPDSSSSGDNGIGGLFGDDSTDGTGSDVPVEAVQVPVEAVAEQTLMVAVTLAQVQVPVQDLAQVQVPVQDLETQGAKAKLK